MLFQKGDFLISDFCSISGWAGVSDCSTVLPIVLPPEMPFDWSGLITQFLVTLLAAALSVFVAKYTVQKSARVDMEKLRLERLEDAKSKALTVALKIMNYGELLAGIERHLSRQFRQAETDGCANTEPYQIIRPAQGKDIPPEVIMTSEMSFLIDQHKFELISNIALLYRRTLNATHLISEHSVQRSDLEHWLHGLPGHKGKLDGDIANDAIPVEFADAYTRRAANLNILISEVVDQVDDTLALLPTVFEEFVGACQDEFGENFPRLKVSFPNEPITLTGVEAACTSHAIPFGHGVPARHFES